MALALGLRAFELGELSLWIDEAFSAWVVGHDLAAIWRDIPRVDTHPPLYYALLEVWSLLFGDSEAALRSLSVAFAVATVPVMHAAGRALAPSPAWLAPLAATLFALAPFQIAYAQEARSYAALAFAASLALLGGLRLLREPAAARGPWLGWGTGAGARDAWALLVLGWAACLWFHNLGFLVLAASLPPLAAWCLLDRRAGRAVLLNLALAAALALLLWAPNLGRALAQAGEVAGGFWLAAPSARTVARTLEKLFALERLGDLDPWPLLAGLQAWGLVWLWRRGAAAQAAFLAGLALLPVLASLAASFTVAPVFLDRTLLWAALPGYLALAAGIAGLPRRWARPLALVAVLVLFGWASVTYHTKKSKEPWREVAAAVAAGWRPGDAVAAAPPYAGKPLAYYGGRHGFAGELLVPRWEDPTQGQDRPDFERRLRAAQRVWLVTRTENGFDPEGYWLTAALDRQRPRLWRRVFPDRLGLVLFGPPAARSDSG